VRYAVRQRALARRTLTNYRTIRNRLKRLQELEAMWLPAGENVNKVDLNSYIAGLMTDAGNSTRRWPRTRRTSARTRRR